MLNDLRWKFIAVVVILAMVVSLLAGGLSGVPFGMLILRAVTGGIVFAILAAGLNILIARFFPEILESYESGFTAGEGIDGVSSEEGLGSRVDIVMPGESLDEADGSAEAEEIHVGSEGSTGGKGGIESSGDETIEELPGEDDDAGESGMEPRGDLDRFSGDFSDVGDDSPSKSSAGDGIMGDHDVEEIAQAIHTVITRDGKG